MKVYVLDPIYPNGLEILKRHAEIVLWDDPGVAHWPDDADAVIVRRVRIGEADIGRAKRLKVIAKQGAGVENIDLDAARKHGLKVFNTAGVNAEAVAEMSMALALCVARRVAHADRALRAGETVVREKFHGRGFAGKTIGIIGMGHVGRRVAAKWKRAFDMTVLGYDPFLPDDIWETLDCERSTTVEAMLPVADLLSIHSPLTDETRGLIGARELAHMKPTAILVSLSRGGVVDERALHDALSTDRIYGAALDVFEVEPPPPDHPLLGLANFVATPHIGGGAIEAHELNAVTVVEGLLAAMRGEEPPNVIV